MSKTIFLIFLLNTTLLPLDLSNIQDLTNWEEIQDKPVKIEWTKHKGFPISRSEIILGHPIDKVFNTIQRLESYPEIFNRVDLNPFIDSLKALGTFSLYKALNFLAPEMV